MTIDLLRADLACVTEQLGNRIERERYCVRDACGNWLDDVTGRLVDAATQSAIDDALTAARRTRYSILGRS